MSTEALRRSSRTSSLSSLPGSERSLGWGAELKQWQPDSVRTMDSTVLNLEKQKRAKDPRLQLREEFERQKKIKELIEGLMRKPFKIRCEPSYKTKIHSVRSQTILEESAEQEDTSRNDGNSAGVGETVRDDNDGSLVTDKVAARKKYIVAHFDFYFKIKSFHYPSEFAMAEFSVFNGLGKGIQGIIDIGTVADGFDHDVREHCRITRNPLPGFDEDFDPDRDALRLIEDFLACHFEKDELVILFALKEYVPIVIDGLEWLFDITGRRFKYEVLPLTNLVQELMNESQSKDYRPADSGNTYYAPHECLLEKEIHHNKYSYYPDLACEYHAKPDNIDGLHYCCESQVKSLIYNSFRLLQPLFQFKEKPNAHYPQLKILTPKKGKRNGFSNTDLPGTPHAVGVMRFTSSDRMTDILSSYSGTMYSESELSASHGSLATFRNVDSSGSSENDLSSSSCGSLIAEDAGNFPKNVPPQTYMNMKCKWPVDLKKFQVDPDFRYGYHLDFQLKKELSGESEDARPTFEEGLLDGNIGSFPTPMPLSAVLLPRGPLAEELAPQQPLCRGRGRGRGISSGYATYDNQLPSVSGGSCTVVSSSEYSLSDPHTSSTRSGYGYAESNFSEVNSSIQSRMRSVLNRSESSLSTSSTLPDSASVMNLRIDDSDAPDDDDDYEQFESASLAAMKHISFK